MLAVAVLSVPISAASAQEGVKNDGTVDAEAIFTELVASSGLVALSASVVSGDRIVWQGGFGKADIERNIPVTPKTLFMQASVSKLFTGAALLRLEEQGLCDLDEDINRHLPFEVRNPAFPDVPITLRMLLTYHSSIADRQEVVTALYVTGDSDVSLGEFLKDYLHPKGSYFSPQNFHEFAPGTKNQYGNIAFALIAYLAERVSKQAFPQLCRDVLFTPLEMNETSWFLADLDERNIARQYIAGDTGQDVEPVSHYGWAGYPDGQLRSSAPQVANFLIMMMNEGRFAGRQVLKKTTVEKMLSRQHFKDLPAFPFREIDMGLVWNLTGLGDREVYMKTGRGSGITTVVLFEPKTHIGFVLLMTGPFEDLGKFPEMVNVLMAQGATE
jgi:CubicO group peptidase (beta-lactamase class C family)